MKNKVGCLLIAAALIICCLAGCTGGDKANATSEAVALSSYKDATVGVCIYQLNDNFMSLFRDELVRYLISKGFSKDRIIVYDSTNNEGVQLSQVEELIGSGVDALIINPVNSNVARSITDMAVGSKVPLVYINREPTGDEESRWEEYDFDVTYVGCDARQSGIYQAELLMDIGASKLDKNGDGRVDYYMIEGAPENIDAGYRTMYAVSSLQKAGLDLYCLLDDIGNWDMETAHQITEKGLAQGLVPEVIICNNDAMALGAINAVIEAGLRPGQDVYVVGVDALPEALTAVRTGDMVGTVFNDYILQSHRAANAVINYLNGDDNEHYIGCDYVKVTGDNVDEILSWINNPESAQD